MSYEKTKEEDEKRICYLYEIEKKNTIKKEYHKAIGEEYINGSTLKVIANKYSSSISSISRILDKI